jgi:tetratricopeptide (TPR) repeat protein
MLNSQQYDEPVRLMRRILAETPDKPLIIYNLAFALTRMEHHQEAEQQCLKAIALYDARDVNTRLALAEAWNLLGTIQAKQLNHVAAVDSYRHAVAIVPELPRPHFNLAMALYLLGDWVQGDGELALALRYGSPEWTSVYRQLASERKHEQQQRHNNVTLIQPSRPSSIATN